MDLASKNDEEGSPWDFSVTENRNKIREYVKVNKPLFIIGSPAQTVLQSISADRIEEMREDTAEEIKKRCADHQKFMAEISSEQINNKRLFMHEVMHGSQNTEGEDQKDKGTS